jgi:hypothetical protein
MTATLQCFNRTPRLGDLGHFRAQPDCRLPKLRIPIICIRRNLSDACVMEIRRQRRNSL